VVLGGAWWCLVVLGGARRGQEELDGARFPDTEKTNLAASHILVYCIC
jgi:hypothetical protein